MHRKQPLNYYNHYLGEITLLFIKFYRVFLKFEILILGILLQTTTANVKQKTKQKKSIYVFKNGFIQHRYCICMPMLFY